MLLTQNDWYCYNDLVFKVHSIPTLDEMRLEVMHFLKILIPCDAMTFFLASKDSYMCSPIVIGTDQKHVESYLGDLGEIDPKKWIFMSNQNKVFRESDLLPDDVRAVHHYYQRAYSPINMRYGVVLSMAYENKFVGVVTLLRTEGHEDFSDRDILILDMLKTHLSFRLYKEIFDAPPASDKEQQFLDRFSQKYSLSNQETEILALLADGSSADDICKTLFISSSTLKKHTSNIYRKTRVKNRGALYSLIMNEKLDTLENSGTKRHDANG